MLDKQWATLLPKGKRHQSCMCQMWYVIYIYALYTAIDSIYVLITIHVITQNMSHVLLLSSLLRYFLTSYSSYLK